MEEYHESLQSSMQWNIQWGKSNGTSLPSLSRLLARGKAFLVIGLRRSLLISSNLLLISPRCLDTYEPPAILFTNGFENRGVLSIVLDFRFLGLSEAIKFGVLFICARLILRAGATFGARFSMFMSRRSSRGIIQALWVL